MRIAAAAGALLLAACTQTTELIAPEMGCGLRIDVFGGSNVQLVACGGPAGAPPSLAEGLYAPGDPAYDATLAGRLRARLLEDGELRGRFGGEIAVRSCGFTGQALSGLSPPVAADACGAPAAPAAMGQHQGACAQDPAPILLLLATGEDDGCHGGGAGSPFADDKAGYADHLASRLAAFLDARRPALALLGPRTEWVAAPVPPHPPGQPDAGACAWKRGDWDESGLRRWQDLHPDQANVALFGHLHAEYAQHHPCCRFLDVPCAQGWFATDGNTDRVLNCAGAQALVDFWFTRLRKTLLEQGRCPGAT